MLRLSSFQKIFVVTLVFVTAASFLFWLDFFRASSARLEILVLPKTQMEEGRRTAHSPIFSGTLRFYDRLLETHEEITDASAGRQADDRKAFWQNRVQARAQQGNAVSVTFLASSEEEARALSRAYFQTLLGQASLYYNLKTQVDIRAVDGPIVAPRVANPFGYITLSLFSGIAVTSLFFLILRLFFGVGRPFPRHGAESDLPIGKSVPWLRPAHFTPSPSASLAYKSEESTPEKPLVSNTFDQVLSSVEPHISKLDTASAPANLPVVDEVPAFLFGDGKPSPEPVPEQKEEILLSEGSAGEPTVEEYKRRLNQLLRGQSL
ncbi:MAG: hypothetical protein WDN67_04030 [Candidatus Moraniibacteriota bacterium]